MNELEALAALENAAETAVSAAPYFNVQDLWPMLSRFGLNLLAVWILIHFFYYRKSRRMDYYFTFILISVSIFFLIYLLGSVKLKIGFALGVFAIFGIIRYRTESVPIREMTYLFTITALSVINGLSVQMSLAELLCTNLVFVLVTWILESVRWKNHTNVKMVLYDKIQLVTPDRYDELVADLRQRTGLDITKVEVGHLDFLKDAAYIKVYYNADEPATIGTVTKFPKFKNNVID